MQNLEIEHWSAREVFHWGNHVFKIPKWIKWVDENILEVELGKKSRLALDTFNLRSLWILSLEPAKLFEMDLWENSVDRILFSEILAYSQDIRGIVNSIWGIEVWDINVQIQLNQGKMRILKTIMKSLICNWQISCLQRLINDILQLNFNDNRRIYHTLNNLGNFWITPENEILLLDWWFSLEWWSEEELLAKLDLIYDFLNNSELLTPELLSDIDLPPGYFLKLSQQAA